MPDIFELNDRFRWERLRQERRAALAMVEAYRIAYGRIRERLADLTGQIAELRAAGRDVPVEWLFQFRRLPVLQEQVEQEILAWSNLVGQSITDQQRLAVDAALDHAEQLVLAGLGQPPPGVTVTFARLPREALADLVGFLSDGSPLRVLLDELGPAASKAVREALVGGLALGQSPREIARRVRAELGGSLVRALRISRTEVLRSYREANHRSYKANDDVVKGWVWHSALGSLTCPACYALHGTVHRLDERLDDHVNGRCAAIPVTRSWSELGFRGITDTRPKIERGVDIFARLPEAEQVAVLGPAAFAAYRSGDISLEDFIGVRHSDRWGSMRYARSLKAILGEREANDWRRRVAS